MSFSIKSQSHKKIAEIIQRMGMGKLKSQMCNIRDHQFSRLHLRTKHYISLWILTCCASAYFGAQIYAATQSPSEKIGESTTLTPTVDKKYLKSFAKLKNTTPKITLDDLQEKLVQVSANLESLTLLKNQLAEQATPKRVLLENDSDLRSYSDLYQREVAKAITSAPTFNNSGVAHDDIAATVNIANKMNDQISAMKGAWGRDIQKLSQYPTGVPIANGTGLTSNFGPRVNPFTKKLSSHNGVDFSAPEGTKILATGDGVVLKAESDALNGQHIEIKHVSGYHSFYGHLRKMNVRAGENIKRGQFIAEVGSTGRSTNPHLHYEISYKGSPINPMEALLQNALPAPVIAGQQTDGSKEGVDLASMKFNLPVSNDLMDQGQKTLQVSNSAPNKPKVINIPQ